MATGIKTVPNKRPPDTVLKVEKVAFHNPSPPGAAMSREMTTTECLHLPVPAQGSMGNR